MAHRRASRRRQRRALATPISAEALARLDHLRRLRQVLLCPLPEAASLDTLEQEAIIAAVLGTVVGSAVTAPEFLEAMVTLGPDQLDLDAGVLTWARPGSVIGPSVWQRLPLDPVSRLLWGRLRLVHATSASRPIRANAPVLSATWDTIRLRLAVDTKLRLAGFASWSALLRTVRLAHLLGGLPPICVARRAGRLPTVLGAGHSWPALGWPVRDPEALSVEAAGPPAMAGTQMRRARPAAWRGSVRDILRSLNALTETAGRHRIASALEHQLADRDWATMAPAIGRAYVQWAISLPLATRRRRSRSVKAMLSRVARLLDQEATTATLLTGTTSVEATATVTSMVVEAYPAIESRLAALSALREFLQFAANKTGVGLPILDWRAARRAIGQTPAIASRLSPADVRLVATGLRATGPSGLALAAAVVLAAYGGLRRGEICQLAVDDIIWPGWVVHVRWTKTPAGRRLVHLGCLLPPWAREMLEAAADRARRQPGITAWLVTEAGAPWDADALSARVTRALRRSSGQHVSIHGLRRAAATWWLLQWASGEPGIGVQDLGPEAPPVSGVRSLLGDDPTTVLFSLARLLGHAWPGVTVARYAAAIDRIEASTLGATSSTWLPLSVAADLLAVSPRWARARLPVMRGAVQTDAVLVAQHRRLEERERRRARGSQPASRTLRQ